MIRTVPGPASTGDEIQCSFSQRMVYWYQTKNLIAGTSPPIPSRSWTQFSTILTSICIRWGLKKKPNREHKKYANKYFSGLTPTLHPQAIPTVNSWKAHGHPETFQGDWTSGCVYCVWALERGRQRTFLFFLKTSHTQVNTCILQLSYS